MSKISSLTSQVFFLLTFSAIFLGCQNNNASGVVDSVTPSSATIDTMKRDSIASVSIAPLRIKEQNGQCTLFLSDEIKQALHDYDSTFQIWKSSDFVKSCDGNPNYYKCSERQLQYAVIGDFNGDSIKDVVVFGRNRKQSLVLGVISQNDTYQVIKIEELPYMDPKKEYIDDKNNIGLSEILNYYDPKEIPSKEKEFVFKYDAFTFGIYGKGSAIFWYENGVFKSKIFSD